MALSLLLSIVCVGRGRCSEKHFFRLLNFLNYVMFFLDFEKGGKNLNIQNCIPHTHTQKVKSKRILPFTFYVLRILRYLELRIASCCFLELKKMYIN